MFTPLAILLGVVAGAVLFWPLLSRARQTRLPALLMVFAMPVATLLLYQQIGTPEGIGVNGRPAPVPDMFELVEQLEQRMQQNPADAEGWLLLGRSYKTLQRYPQAEAALLRAVQLAPGSSLVLAELAEAKLFASGEPVISAEQRELLEKALALDPEQQKALWLMGMAAGQQGDPELALTYWERLLDQLEPGSPVARSVREQMARVRPGADVSRNGSTRIDVHVSFDGDPSTLPDHAVLYVIVRDPLAPAPPLGARRIPNPDFPITLTLTDADSMLEQRPISGATSVELFARISMEGGALATEGDPESAMVAVDTMQSVMVELSIRAPGATSGQ